MIHPVVAGRVAPGLSRTGILSKESEEFPSFRHLFGFVTAALTLALTTGQNRKKRGQRQITRNIASSQNIIIDTNSFEIQTE